MIHITEEKLKEAIQTGLGQDGLYTKLLTEGLIEQIKALAISSVSSSLTAKEAIDYQIKAKRKDKEENLKDWAKATAFVCLFCVLIIIILKSCSS